MASIKPLTASDLYGRQMISYMRFSSSAQEGGSTLVRQRETLDRVKAYYRLVEDDALLDKARSASKGHHRTKGELGGFLAAIKTGEIQFRDKVFVVEAIDRPTGRSRSRRLCRDRSIQCFIRPSQSEHAVDRTGAL